MPPALAAFLAAGPAPVYLGFGSMPDADPAGLVAALVGGARRAGHRMVLHSGWSRLRATGLLDDDVLVIDDVPHSLLFPRMAAVVHHGGAGTTAAALRAGVAAVVIPLFADQFFWGRRVAALGPAPRRSPANGSPTRGSRPPSPWPSVVATEAAGSRRSWRPRTGSPRPSPCSRNGWARDAPGHATARAAANACPA